MTNIPKNVTLNKLRPWRAHAITLLLLATALALAACLGGDDEESAMMTSDSAAMEVVEVVREVPVERIVEVERTVVVEKVVTAAPAPAQAAARAPNWRRPGRAPSRTSATRSSRSHSLPSRNA